MRSESNTTRHIVAHCENSSSDLVLACYPDFKIIYETQNDSCLISNHQIRVQGQLLNSLHVIAIPFALWQVLLYISLLDATIP